MGEGFEHLRCPTCGGELIYSEGTHDLCCSRNPYESTAAGAEEAGGALHEERAEYGDEKNSHIYLTYIRYGGRKRLAGSGKVQEAPRLLT